MINISSAALAFLGDSVYEVKIRLKTVNTIDKKAAGLNKFSKLYTNAKTQALMAGLIIEFFSEEELSVFKRARNMKQISAPKSCTVSEYRRATGLEALMGYLYLKGDEKRIEELLDAGMNEVNKILKVTSS